MVDAAAERRLAAAAHGTTLSISLTKEVANAWGCRVGTTDQAAPADRVQSLFNDIELYPTKSQVFEMLAWARQCARRKSFTLTFGEFCVFAAELRRCSKQARLTPTNQSKPESPNWNVDKEIRDKDTVCKYVNGSESPPPCEVFLGGSCNPTTWRSDIAIPMLKKMGITYFNPQVEDWSSELMEVEHRAKAAARALLFVLDSETRAVAASVEVAHHAAAPRDLLLVLRPYSRHQTIGNETISDQEYIELSRARATLQEAVERRGLPAFMDIPAALRCARAVLRGARTHPRLSLGHTIVRLKRAYDAAGGRNSNLSRTKALDALQDVTKVQREVIDDYLPPAAEAIDFETFCAAVAELSSEPENQDNNKQEGEGLDRVQSSGASEGTRAGNGLRRVHNARLKAYGRKLGLYIPKKGANRSSAECSGSEAAEPGSQEGITGVTGGTGEVFTPGTQRRLERLPAMLGAPMHHVYLGGAFPSNQTRPEEILRREGFTYVVARANDYSRMFSAPARRAAGAHPESPRRDKKPRPAPGGEAGDDGDEEVQLRERGGLSSSSAVGAAESSHADRLSASDFYTVADDLTPQPFKGTYDEDLLLGSKILVFSMSADAPCFATMVLAAHYMGLRPGATVLIVQPMASHSPAHQYSEVAVKDYNRGRHYLTDLAKRSNVPVFDNVNDAMTCVVARLQNT